MNNPGLDLIAPSLSDLNGKGNFECQGHCTFDVNYHSFILEDLLLKPGRFGQSNERKSAAVL